MKKIFLYISIVFLAASLFLLNILHTKITSKYNDNKKQLILLKETMKNNHKDTNKNIYYNNVIHTVNKYNGEIKEFKSKNKNISVVITIAVKRDLVNDILEKLKSEKAISRINSIAFQSENTGKEGYTIVLDADFSNSDI